MKPKLQRLANKRLERFVTLFARALVNDAPDVIHDLRVASRRLQQTLQLFSPASNPAMNRKLTKFLRKARRAFGTCRNLDVSMALVEKRQDTATAPPARRGWATVKQWLESQRAMEIAEAHADLKRFDLIDFIARAQRSINTMTEQPEKVSQLWQRATDALAAWSDDLAAARAKSQTEKIHQLRIAGKRLRYRLEALTELGEDSIKPLLQNLKTLQNDLGDWHDRRVFQQHVGEFIERPGFLTQEPGMCRTLLLEMERDKQRDQARINEVLNKAEKVAGEWRELKQHEASTAEGTTDQ